MNISMPYSIHRVEIPVIIMGETGCGKTKLIDFMSKLQVPTALKDEINTMIIVKVGKIVYFNCTGFPELVTCPSAIF